MQGTPFAELDSEGRTPGGARCLSAGRLLAEVLGPSSEENQPQAQGGRREEKPHPLDCLQGPPCSRPLVLEGPPHPISPREKQFGVPLREHRRFGYIGGSLVSETQGFPR